MPDCIEKNKKYTRATTTEKNDTTIRKEKQSMKTLTYTKPSRQTPSTEIHEQSRHTAYKFEFLIPTQQYRLAPGLDSFEHHGVILLEHSLAKAVSRRGQRFDFGAARVVKCGRHIATGFAVVVGKTAASPRGPGPWGSCSRRRIFCSVRRGLTYFQASPDS